MRHFADARRAALAAAATLTDCDGVCLIWDLQGRLRLLVQIPSGTDVGTVAANASTTMSNASGDFWSGIIWMSSPDVRPTEAERHVYDEAWRLARPAGIFNPEVRELDRHLSKETWFGAPLSPPWPLKVQTPAVIAFYSFKGGVGRTTALAAFAVQMARAGKRVCVIDMDLEAPGIGTLLPSPAGQASHGVVDFLIESRIANGLDLSDYYHLCDDTAVVGSGPPIVVVPAGALDNLYLEKLARVDYDGLVTAGGDRTNSGLSLLLKELKKERQADYVLIDSRAGLHDIGGLALNGVAHLDVVFSTDSEQSWQGLELVVAHLGERRVQQGFEQQLFALVYAMAPSQAQAERQPLLESFRDRAHQLLSDRFYHEEPDEGWPNPVPDDVWPVPAIDDTTEPHYAIPIGFNMEVHRITSIRAVAQLLTEGDYATFAAAVLERLGRTTP